MKVFLAGYNVDTEVLKELEAQTGERDDLTPEVISASYARISRDARPIEDIRKDARLEVEKTRRSNSSIIFKMGHHSVAEHAVFNLDVTGVSRYAMEELEKFRLSSYTEKSQRYITLEDDYVLPEEITGTQHERIFTETIQLQNKAYFELYDKLKEYVFDRNADLASDIKNHNLLEGWAKEDARYITSLATESQVGQTINARNLELLLRRFASHPLKEVNALGRLIYEQISEVAPSVVLFHEANDRDLNTYPELKETAGSLLGADIKNVPAGEENEVNLVSYTVGADETVCAALLHTATNMPYEGCFAKAAALSGDEKIGLLKAAWKNLQFYDSMLREFEYVNMTFNIELSAACFGQLKRHRMSTITSQQYDPALGITIPEAVKAIGMESYFSDITAKTEDVYYKIAKDLPFAAPYILSNAHRKRVLMRVNAREMYHISRLREDAHAQWDIRNISRAMSREAKRIMPLTLAMIGGKDVYNEIYADLFGVPPKVVEVVLPGARKIK